MFKRMSVLVRREGDTREQFLQGWLRHGRFIADLPGLRGYVQNHVVQEFALPGAPFLRADGFVELQFDSPEAMARAFTSPAARAMAQDEPNFLGHGSGYALRADTGLGDAEAGDKLIVALGEGDAAALVAAARLPGLIRDDVAALIAKPGMAPPQPVSSFCHIFGVAPARAHQTVDAMARVAADARLPLAVFRVKTVRFA